MKLKFSRKQNDNATCLFNFVLFIYLKGILPFVQVSKCKDTFRDKNHEHFHTEFRDNHNSIPFQNPLILHLVNDRTRHHRVISFLFLLQF